MQQHNGRITITLSKEYYPGLSDRDKHVKPIIYFRQNVRYHTINPKDLIDFAELSESEKVLYDEYIREYCGYIDPLKTDEQPMNETEVNKAVDEYKQGCID